MAHLQIRLDDDVVISMPISSLLFEYGIYAQEGTMVTTSLSDGVHRFEVSERLPAPPQTPPAGGR